jgi:hypothetical protein
MRRKVAATRGKESFHHRTSWMKMICMTRREKTIAQVAADSRLGVEGVGEVGEVVSDLIVAVEVDSDRIVAVIEMEVGEEEGLPLVVAVIEMEAEEEEVEVDLDLIVAVIEMEMEEEEGFPLVVAVIEVEEDLIVAVIEVEEVDLDRTVMVKEMETKGVVAADGAQMQAVVVNAGVPRVISFAIVMMNLRSRVVLAIVAQAEAEGDGADTVPVDGAKTLRVSLTRARNATEATSEEKAARETAKAMSPKARAVAVPIRRLGSAIEARVVIAEREVEDGVGGDVVVEVDSDRIVAVIEMEVGEEEGLPLVVAVIEMEAEEEEVEVDSDRIVAVIKMEVGEEEGLPLVVAETEMEAGAEEVDSDLIVAVIEMEVLEEIATAPVLGIRVVAVAQALLDEETTGDKVAVEVPAVVVDGEDLAAAEEAGAEGRVANDETRRQENSKYFETLWRVACTLD